MFNRIVRAIWASKEGFPSMITGYFKHHPLSNHLSLLVARNKVCQYLYQNLTVISCHTHSRLLLVHFVKLVLCCVLSSVSFFFIKVFLLFSFSRSVVKLVSLLNKPLQYSLAVFRIINLDTLSSVEMLGIRSFRASNDLFRSTLRCRSMELCKSLMSRPLSSTLSMGETRFALAPVTFLSVGRADLVLAVVPFLLL